VVIADEIAWILPKNYLADIGCLKAGARSRSLLVIDGRQPQAKTNKPLKLFSY
jgi:hypothetical protein